ncbi:MAG: ProQ/FINO family protein [Halothiobacillaceae bacterium]
MSDEASNPQPPVGETPQTPPGAESSAGSPVCEAEAEAASSAESTPEGAGEAQPKKKRLPHPREVIDRLIEAWPEVFTRDPRAVRPLAIGILKQILAARPETLDGLNSQAIRRGVKFYTSSIAYHRAMLNATHRVALDGSQADEITEDMREHARKELERIPKPVRKSRKPEGEGSTEASRPRRARRRRAGDGAEQGADGGADSAPGDRSSRPGRGGNEGKGRQRGPGGGRRSDRRSDEAVASDGKPASSEPPQTMEEKLAQLAKHFSGE